MFSFIDEIKSRRSIRKYNKTLVPRETLRALIETAVYAPSAHNAQPWRFIALTEPEDKEDLANAMGQVWLKELEANQIPQDVRWHTVDRSVSRFSSAPALIVACLSMENMDQYPDAERQRAERDLAVQSLGAAVQTLLLAAHAEGLGACWYCAPSFCKPVVRKALDIPAEVEPQALITVGYPDEKPQAPPRKPLGDYAYAGLWGKLL
jgi:coenzyme F420-0:L-glutamate ligase / coenzyme F420-1:gamma-L-glutamate ligase